MTIKPRIGMVSETKLKLVSVWLTAGVSRMFWTKYSSTINDNGFETKRVGPVCVMLSQTFLYVFYARNISQRQRVGGLKRRLATLPPPLKYNATTGTTAVHLNAHPCSRTST